MAKRYIVLEDGHVFEGEACGADGDAVGELVFTTNMCGYMETLTDPSYYGQIIMQTFPLVGNYGYIPDDMESPKIYAKAYVARELCDKPSNFRSEGSIDLMLRQNGIPGICGVDTRRLTRIIRENGVMNAKIVSDISKVNAEGLKSYKVCDAVANVSEKGKTFAAENESCKVVLIDYGAKMNIIKELNKRGCTVTTVPYDASDDEILSLNPNGIMLSNGPGDPKDNSASIETIKNLFGKVPMLGICLGHQLMALAAGGDTAKLKYGHRGGNQPVRDLKTGRVYITSQNHGYAVKSDSELGFDGKISFVNANDGTCEGVEYPEIHSFSIQFHPEACAGPRDAESLFDKFVEIIKEYRKNA